MEKSVAPASTHGHRLRFGESSTPMQDRLAQSRSVLQAEWRQHGVIRQPTDQTLALQRRPHCGIAQPGCVARRDDGLAQMEMVAMRQGWVGDDDAARLLARSRII